MRDEYCSSSLIPLPLVETRVATELGRRLASAPSVARKHWIRTAGGQVTPGLAFHSTPMLRSMHFPAGGLLNSPIADDCRGREEASRACRFVQARRNAMDLFRSPEERLFLAAAHNHPAKARRALQKGADPNWVNPQTLVSPPRPCQRRTGVGPTLCKYSAAFPNTSTEM